MNRGQAPMQGAEEVQEDAPPDPAEGLPKGNVLAQEGDLQAFRPERHDRSGIQGIQVFGMPPPGQSGQAPGGLRDRGRDDGIEEVPPGPFDGLLERPEGAFPVLPGRTAARDVPRHRAGIVEIESRDRRNGIPLLKRGVDPEAQCLPVRVPDAPIPEYDETRFGEQGRGRQRLEYDFRADPPGIAEADPDRGEGHFLFFVSSPAGSGASPTL